MVDEEGASPGRMVFLRKGAVRIAESLISIRKGRKVIPGLGGLERGRGPVLPPESVVRP